MRDDNKTVGVRNKRLSQVTIVSPESVTTLILGDGQHGFCSSKSKPETGE